MFAFGDAPFLGSLGTARLNAPIVDILSTSRGDGYRLAAADGGVFTFGTVSFAGAASAVPLKAPIVAIAA